MSEEKYNELLKAYTKEVLANMSRYTTKVP